MRIAVIGRASAPPEVAPPLPAALRSRTEARLGLVPGSVFKTDGAPRERAFGGFDSRALPPYYEEI
jgi:hypothetical protein